MADVFGTNDPDILDAADGVTDFGDRIYGLGGSDEIYGLGGRDLLDGGAGGDILDGGADLDIAIYDTSPAAVFVSLVTGGVGGDANGDVYVSVEDIIGSPFDDFLVGDDGANFINGIEGNNTIQGRGGNDILNAYQGNDTMSGGDGDDRVFASSGNDTLDGGSGNDDLTGSAGNDNIAGADGDDTIEGGEGADIVDGGNGIDTANYGSGAVGAMVVNLNSGTASDGDSLTGFENVNGSAFGDIITGNIGANSLNGVSGNDSVNGGGGDDTLAGFAGDDVLTGNVGADHVLGGAGTDRASYAGSNAAVTVSLTLGTASGGHADGDVLAEVEDIGGSSFNDALTGDDAGANRLIGGAGDDTLAGLAGDDRLEGGDGNDLMAGGAGADSLGGGAGTDRADYSGSNSAVTVNLGAGNAAGGHAQGDSFVAVEDVSGSNFADALLGDGAANRLTGQNGADLLTGSGGNDVLVGGAGADELYGGTGTDLADYAASSAAIAINLASAAATDGHAQDDILAGVENLNGSAFNDTLTGDIFANSLNGGNGGDRLSGGSANDTLTGSLGDDVLNGGTGVDRYRYTSAAFGKDAIQGFEDGLDKIDLRGSGLTFASFTETQVGANTVLTLTANPTQTITLANINANLIDAADFLV